MRSEYYEKMCIEISEAVYVARSILTWINSVWWRKMKQIVVFVYNFCFVNFLLKKDQCVAFRTFLNQNLWLTIKTNSSSAFFAIHAENREIC